MLTIASLSASRHQPYHCTHSKNHLCIGVAPQHRWTCSLSAQLLLVAVVLLCGGCRCERHGVRCCNGCKSCCQLPSPPPCGRGRFLLPSLALGCCQRAPALWWSMLATLLACWLLAGICSHGLGWQQGLSPSYGGGKAEALPPWFYNLNGKTDAANALLLAPHLCPLPAQPLGASGLGLWCCHGFGGAWLLRVRGSHWDPVLVLHLANGKGLRSQGTWVGGLGSCPGPGCLLQERTTAMSTPLLIALLCLTTSILQAQGREVSLSHPGVGLGAFGTIQGSLGWGRLGSGAGCCTLRLSFRNNSDRDGRAGPGEFAAAGLQQHPACQVSAGSHPAVPRTPTFPPDAAPSTLPVQVKTAGREAGPPGETQLHRQHDRDLRVQVHSQALQRVKPQQQDGSFPQRCWGYSQGMPVAPWAGGRCQGDAGVADACPHWFSIILQGCFTPAKPPETWLCWGAAGSWGHRSPAP